jgi:hypothetical protein
MQAEKRKEEGGHFFCLLWAPCLYICSLNLALTKKKLQLGRACNPAWRCESWVLVLKTSTSHSLTRYGIGARRGTTVSTKLNPRHLRQSEGWAPSLLQLHWKSLEGPTVKVHSVINQFYSYWTWWQSPLGIKFRKEPLLFLNFNWGLLASGESASDRYMLSAAPCTKGFPKKPECRRQTAPQDGSVCPITFPSGTPLPSFFFSKAIGQVWYQESCSLSMPIRAQKRFSY